MLNVSAYSMAQNRIQAAATPDHRMSSGPLRARSKASIAPLAPIVPKVESIDAESRWISLDISGACLAVIAGLVVSLAEQHTPGGRTELHPPMMISPFDSPISTSNAAKISPMAHQTRRSRHSRCIQAISKVS
jgi:hypothetical protein